MNKTVELQVFAQRLSSLLADSDETTYSLANKLGLTPATISRYANALMKPKVPTVISMAQIFNVNEAWLMGYNVPKETQKLKSNQHSTSGILPIPKMVKKPRLGIIACGEPILAEENLEGYDDVPEDIKCDFTLICKGDSMINARINNNDIVYIRQQNIVDNGEIAAVLIDNEATLKRVYIYDDKVVLQPENTKYAPLVYSKEEMNNVKIIGKAVGFTSRL